MRVRISSWFLLGLATVQLAAQFADGRPELGEAILTKGRDSGTSSLVPVTVSSAEKGFTKGEAAFGRNVMEAYSRAYPKRHLQVVWRNNDWAFQLNSRWFHWAEGRLLPEDEDLAVENFSSYSFYSYPVKLPRQPIFNRRQESLFQQRLQERKSSKSYRHKAFLTELYQAGTQLEADRVMQKTLLDGKRVVVHQMLIPILAELDSELKILKQTNTDVRQFLARINGISGYAWREVAFFNSLSYHSLGLAIDFLPSRWNVPVYWLWSSDFRDDWYNIPYYKRWQVPKELVKLFERYGFIWGGKWLFFDNMHFEYRPELLELQQLSPEQWPKSPRTKSLNK